MMIVPTTLTCWFCVVVASAYVCLFLVCFVHSVALGSVDRVQAPHMMAKRQRVSVTEMSLKENDPDLVRAAFALGAVNLEQWLDGLTPEAFAAYVKDFGPLKHNDRIAFCTTDHINEVKAIKVVAY